MSKQLTNASGSFAARFPPELTLGEARARLFALSGSRPRAGLNGTNTETRRHGLNILEDKAASLCLCGELLFRAASL